ncbi:unnamed protein product, partial [Thelazia callipaeda]|uniref:B9 domain-containing protein 1 n=1 Tax=Thelazia callipaeda TaxID=103827 RepID=A0A0N5CQ30_THECL
FPFFDNFFCKYSYVYGVDWKQVGGIHEGLSPHCERRLYGSSCTTIGMPIEATFTSTNPSGWPQIVLTCYGFDFFGNNVIRGYGAVHIPTIPGRTVRRVPMFVPEASTLLQRFMGWLTGKRAEFVDPKFVATADGRHVTKVRTQGIITITMDIMLKDMKKYGYDVVSTSLQRISECALPDFTESDVQTQVQRKDPSPKHSTPTPNTVSETQPGTPDTTQGPTYNDTSLTRPLPMPRLMTQTESVGEIKEETSHSSSN